MTPPSPTPRARIALIGSPNSGKTTLFNALTGMRGKTGNYPGVTVDRRVGQAPTPHGPVALVDLPGTYSLHAISEDEAVAVKVLRGEMEGESQPDAVAIIADATTLERSLPFIAEVLQAGLRTCLVLTMVDELKARGGEIDIMELRRELGIAVIPVVGNKGIGVDDLRDQLGRHDSWGMARELPEKGTEARFAWADALLQKITRKNLSDSKLTKRLDSILLHPLWGGLVFFTFVLLFFQAIFSWAAPAMDALSGGVEAIADWLVAVMPSGWGTSLLADGIVRGVGAVVVFIPQIALLFALIFFFEACGYMARAAFVMDRLMGWVGLEGRCFISLLSSYACAVPGILATRTIPSPRDRLATVLVAPLMTCSARLPVYALLIATFIPATTVFGPITLQGVVLMALYLLGALSALLFAAVFKRGLLRGATLPFYLELPPYRFPSLASIALQVWRRIKMFLRRAGTVILGMSVLLWFLLNYPKVENSVDLDSAAHQRQQIESSYAASMGKALEPAIAPMGWDWRVGIGLIGSFAAREVIVSTLVQVYAFSGDEDDVSGLGEVLTRPDSVTGKPPLSLASAMALLVFFVFALQCVSTIVVIARETASWKWAIFALVYQTSFAWLTAWICYLVFA